MKKKSYNPFKMWGSWIGAIVGLFIQLYPSALFMIGDKCDPSKIACIPSKANLFISHPVFLSSWININYGTFLSIIVGFLLGWGIHSIFRRLRK